MPTQTMLTDQAQSVQTQPFQSQALQIQSLQESIRNVESAQRIDNGRTISSGCVAIDRLLPQGGYSPGTLIQWLTDGGYGADYLSLRTAVEACRDGGALVIIDPLDQFYPPAVAELGIDMGKLIVLQTTTESDLNWAIDQALRCNAVGAVWGPINSIEERWFRRFQLSAESSGCLGLFIQPAKESRRPSWAEIQWMVTQPSPTVSKNHPAANHPQHHVQLKLARCRSARAGQSISISVDAVTGEIK